MESSSDFILAVAEHPWPSTSGGQLRTAGIAAALAGIGRVTVVSLNMPDPPPLLAPALAAYWRRRQSQPTRLVDLGVGVLRGNHVSLQRSIAAGLPEAFAELVRALNPCAVVLGRPFFGPFVPASRSAGACVIVDADESLVRVSRSVLRSNARVGARVRAFVDLLSAGRMERRDFKAADQLWAGSTIEAQGLSSAAGNAALHIVPNVTTRIPDKAPAAGPVRRVGFVGSFGHPPNEEAAVELMTSVMPAVRNLVGPIELVLIGRDPSRRMRRIAAATEMVRITGQVPDTNLELREAGVLVSPIRSGGGTRLKVIEAAVSGVPVISTLFGVEGLALRPGDDYLRAESPAEFATAIRRLREEPGLAGRLVDGAFHAIAERHSPSALQKAIANAVADCLNTSTRGLAAES